MIIIIPLAVEYFRPSWNELSELNVSDSPS